MEMLIAGQWVGAAKTLDVTNPYDNSVVDTVPRSTAEDADRAFAFAAEGARKLRRVQGYERYGWLMKAADLMEERLEDLARTITMEEGKPIGEARFEVSRAKETIIGSAEEAKRLGSEVVPLDGAPGTENRFGFTLRVPCGVVLAVTPFNFPLNLVCHKVGPAIAAGNAVVVKPATDTPLTALKFAKLLLDAGCPPEAIQVITGTGGEIGDILVSDPRVRKISFTGSKDIGERICRTAGLKKVTMELGSNSPVIVMPDADLEKAATAIAATGYANAGQVCISTQRVVADRKIYADLLDILKPKVEALTAGDPLQDGVKLGPMVKESEAKRVEEWVEQARARGARVLTGGSRSGAAYAATLLADVDKSMRITCEELFGPAVGVTPAETIDEAIAIANDTNYGLSAAIFTESLDNAMRFARDVDSGNIHINWGAQWRADLMPYGGLKDSGFGKEGPKYAIEEMTETKMVVMHLRG
ncbi:MAG: aldehyde dehydrogenase family protein [Acidobacteria bacterium]|nr:aldehyde dehydrogenase family protein [Acidobacteriota bacterium]